MVHPLTPPWRQRAKRPSILSFATLASLLCLPSAAAADKAAADYYVHSLPGAPTTEQLRTMYAGHIEVAPEHHGNLFFWLYKNRHIGDRKRTVLWLNGGPGCSSMDGAMMEVGPYRVNEDGTLRINDGSWDEFANLLFVDNPVGTGFSYVDGDSYLRELDQMASDMITFLDKFFAIFPEHQYDDLYIAGESYAGQHIPHLAKAILDRNAGGSGHEWNVSGLLIGNGWISAPDQYPSYLEFAYEQGLVDRGSSAEKSILDQQHACQEALDAGADKEVDNQACEGILQDILRTTMEGNKCWNMYDVRLRDDYPACGMHWPPDLEQLTPYLRRQDVVKALHINADKKTGWEECSGSVSKYFTARNSKPSIDLLPGLLEKLPIVLFSGDKDMICNHIGTENIISRMEWNGAKGMETSPGVTAPRRDWTFEGEPAGQYQYARNLTYLRFYNASHMVPFDYPRRTRDMLDRFMGVDIASIGGTPADSLIDGEKAHPETSVGGHPNSTVAQEAEEQKLQEAKWAAYQRSGEVVLFFTIVGASIWGFFIIRARRRRQGYRSVFGADPYDGGNGSLASGLGLDDVRRTKYREDRDVEAARDYDEAELDDLSDKRRDMDAENFALDNDDDDEGDVGGHSGNGHAR
ncbi:alpha/beta-hydrolase [Teratosphaeria nubilosa]|uniref:Carboxypeptidase n=1 Tax=Teratosphaeria nubilosa TaxID=161662 RepID=A0A6G1LAU2_9PEZI|nr:alpha/beta-hydrolase [Teratosphaeria nubilosa]